MVSERNKATYAWFTLTPDSAALTCRMLTHINKIMDIIIEKAAIFWDDDEDELDKIKLTKIDVATDMYGSFIPLV